jgi:hypothetical protein
MVAERHHLDLIMAEVLAYLWMVEGRRQRTWAQQLLEALETVSAGRVWVKA